MKSLLILMGLAASVVPVSARAQDDPTVGGIPVSRYLPVPDAVEEARIPIDPEKGYWVGEVADRFYVASDGVWQSGFLVTQDGVILFDAPASFGARLPEIVGTVTELPITHLVYSHAHKDHIAAAGGLVTSIPELRIIGHERVASYLLDVGDPDRPVPRHLFRGSQTLDIGGERIEIDEIGPYHSAEADLFITLPRQRVLYAIDSFTPGWVTFQGLDLTLNTHNYLSLGDEVMSRDWDIFVGGHLTQLGTRDQIRTSIEYTDDVVRIATEVFDSTDMMSTMATAAGSAGWSNPFLLFRYYHDTMVDACAEQLIDRWGGLLAAVDVYAASHCDRLLVYLRVD